MATLYLSKGHTFNTAQETVYSSWTTLYTNGSYSFSGRAHCTLGYTGSGLYSVSQIIFEMKRSSAFTNGTYSIGSTSASSSGFKSSTFSSITTPMGKSFTVNGTDVGVSGGTILKFGSGNSTADTSSLEWSKQKTASATCNAQIALTYRTGTAESTRVTTSFQIKIQLTYSIGGTKCTLTYEKDDGSQYATPVSGAVRSTTTIKNGYNKSSYIDTDSGTYTVSFNSRGGSQVKDQYYPWSWRQSISYIFNKWGGYDPGATYTFIEESKTLRASFTTDPGDRVWTYRTLGALPTATLKGHKKTNEWYYSNGSMASSSDQVTDSFTLKCQWEAQTYKISFNLDGGKIPEEYGKIADYAIDKTYGANNSVRMPPFTPTKVGYVFSGWSDQTGTCRKLQPNEYANDDVYDKENTDSTNKSVTLWAQWELKPNELKFNYFIMDDSGSYTKYTDTEYYNVTQTTYSKHSPSHNDDMSGDYVFIGWCDLMPGNYGWDGPADPSQQGYHGIYTLQTEAPESEIPVTVDITKLKNLEDWGVSQQYYGIWSKTGKYIKVGNTFRKVNSAYVKIDGKWKVITDVWVCQDNKWHHEI